MHAIKQSQQLASWAWDGGRHLVGQAGKIVGALLHVMSAITAFNQEHEAYERSLSLEERLQRTGRVGYR